MPARTSALPGAAVGYAQVLGWGVLHRARFTAAAALARAPACLLPAPLIRSIGLRPTVLCGLLCLLGEQLGSYRARRAGPLLLLALLGSVEAAAAAAVTAAVTAEGAARGLPQAELQASVGSLLQVARFGAALLWGAVYEAGAVGLRWPPAKALRGGGGVAGAGWPPDPSLFYLVGGAIAAAAAAAAATAQLGAGGGAVGGGGGGGGDAGDGGEAASEVVK